MYVTVQTGVLPLDEGRKKPELGKMESRVIVDEQNESCLRM